LDGAHHRLKLARAERFKMQIMQFIGDTLGQRQNSGTTPVYLSIPQPANISHGHAPNHKQSISMLFSNRSTGYQKN